MVFDGGLSCYELTHREFNTIEGIISSSNTKDSAINKIKLFVSGYVNKNIRDETLSTIANYLYEDYNKGILKNKRRSLT